MSMTLSVITDEIQSYGGAEMVKKNDEVDFDDSDKQGKAADRHENAAAL